MIFKFSSRSKLYFIIGILILLIIPSIFYLIRKNQVGADVDNSSTVIDENNVKKIAPDLAIKAGLVHIDDKITAQPQKISIRTNIKNKINQQPHSIIVKMKEGQDINKINKLTNQVQQGLYSNQIEVKSIEPLFKNNLLDKSLQESISKSPLTGPNIEREFKNLNLNNLYLVKTNQIDDTSEVVEKLKSNPAVEYAESNFVARIKMQPDDPLYSSRGSWGQSYDDLWGLKKINPENGWDHSQGENIIVAVSDTGIDYNHEDLNANIWTNLDEIPNNNLDDDTNGYVDDIHGYDFNNYDSDPMDGNGHGTHVAGTIAAVGNNNIGIIGVAPLAKLMAVKGLSDQGAGYVSDLALSIIYAADNGASVINASWGGDGSSQLLQDVINYVHNIKHVTFVAAAGNEDGDAKYHFPANANNVITVSSTDYNDQKSNYSNWGNIIDLAAPGGDSTDYSDPNEKYVNILSLRADGTDLYGDNGQKIVNNKYYRMRGTSMAAPHITGAAALIYAINPNFYPNAVEKILTNSADDIGTPNKDINFGYGRVNATKAINLASTYSQDITPPTTPTNLIAAAIHTRRIDFSWSASTDNLLLIGYKIYRDGIQIADILDNSYSDSDVDINQGSTYQYEVKAYDANNNLSNGVTASVTTPVDNNPPTDPTNLTAATLSTQVNLSWSASMDNYILFGYLIYRDNIEIAKIEATATNYIDFEITSGTSYKYSVRAYDLEDNISNSSNEVNALIPNKVFIDSGIQLPSAGGGRFIAWGDYDNDGDLDLATTRFDDQEFFKETGDPSQPSDTLIYRNDGNGQFAEIQINNLPQTFGGSLAWGDYDNDGDLDLVFNGLKLSSIDDPIGITGIIKNRGNNNFYFIKVLDFTKARMTNPVYGRPAWGDYDNDGDLDLAIKGSKSYWYMNEAYIFYFENISQNNFELKNWYIAGSEGSLISADYDNDSDLDLIQVGGGYWISDTGSTLSSIYKNTGNATFNFVNSPITSQLYSSTSAAVADYNNDGYLDLAISGIHDFWQWDAVIYIYAGSKNGLRKKATLNGMWAKTLAWGDYDNDGDLDLAANDWSNKVKIYRDEGSNNFLDIGKEIDTGGFDGSLSWGDYDNDGDLDLGLSGYRYYWDENDRFTLVPNTKIYQNRTADANFFSKPNNQPSSPVNLSYTNSNNILTLMWGSSSDLETPKKGLYYNFRLGTKPGRDNIISSKYGSPLFGNYLRPKITDTQLGSILNKNLLPGQYYWGVQTIDGGLKTSTWKNKVINIP